MKDILNDNFDWFDEEIDTTNNVEKLRNPFRVYGGEDEERAYLERKEQEKYKKFSNDELEETFWGALINLYYLDEDTSLLYDIKEMLIKRFHNYNDDKYDLKPKQIINYIENCIFSINESEYDDYVLDKELKEYESKHPEEYPENFYQDKETGDYIEY